MNSETGATLAEEQARRLEDVYERAFTLLSRPHIARRAYSVPGEDNWSAVQILGHMVEVVPYWLDHCRNVIAAAGEPYHFGRSLDDPDRLAAVQRPESETSGHLLRLLSDEVHRAASAIRQMTPAERKMIGTYKGQDEMTVAEIIEVFIVAHCENHLAQMRAALES
jgi:uncharacterized damage-inducible protein DinB